VPRSRPFPPARIAWSGTVDSNLEKLSKYHCWSHWRSAISAAVVHHQVGRDSWKGRRSFSNQVFWNYIHGDVRNPTQESNSRSLNLPGWRTSENVFVVGMRNVIAILLKIPRSMGENEPGWPQKAGALRENCPCRGTLLFWECACPRSWANLVRSTLRILNEEFRRRFCCHAIQAIVIQNYSSLGGYSRDEAWRTAGRGLEE